MESEPDEASEGLHEIMALEILHTEVLWARIFLIGLLVLIGAAPVSITSELPQVLSRNASGWVLQFFAGLSIYFGIFANVGLQKRGAGQ